MKRSILALATPPLGGLVMRKLQMISILTCVLLIASANADPYSVTILHPSGFDTSVAWGVSGCQLVGHGSGGASGGYNHALLWSGTAESYVDLHPSGFTQSTAYATSGTQQVGFVSPSGMRRAALWSGTAESYVDLHPSSRFSTSEAKGVSGGQQAGNGYTVGNLHALLWSGTAESYVDLHPAVFDHSSALGISGGQQVGHGTAGGNGHALLWSGTAESYVDLHPATGFDHSAAYATSGSQQVGNIYNTSGPDFPSHAALWSGTAESYVDLHPSGFSSSWARGVSGGQQVGYGVGSATGYRNHALLWSGTASSCVDLHSFLPAGYDESYAFGIDSAGSIVGIAYLPGRVGHACMWFPVTPCKPVSLDSLTAYPLSVPLGDAIYFEATFVDGCGEVDALWDFDDGTAEQQPNVVSPVTTTKTYTSAGVYSVVLTLSDDKVDVGDDITVVVYDPDGGFATGGGWIYSPTGAYKPDSSLTGKGHFAFNAKYQKGTTIPTGETKFKFKPGDLDFQSTSYEWMVVTGSNYVTLKGKGTINDSGEYDFMLWAGDDPDTFRIKIWTEDGVGIETVIYDNGFDQDITGGQISIHN